MTVSLWNFVFFKIYQYFLNIFQCYCSNTWFKKQLLSMQLGCSSIIYIIISPDLDILDTSHFFFTVINNTIITIHLFIHLWHLWFPWDEFLGIELFSKFMNIFFLVSKYICQIAPERYSNLYPSCLCIIECIHILQEWLRSTNQTRLKKEHCLFLHRIEKKKITIFIRF